MSPQAKAGALKMRLCQPRATFPTIERDKTGRRQAADQVDYVATDFRTDLVQVGTVDVDEFVGKTGDIFIVRGSSVVDLSCRGVSLNEFDRRQQPLRDRFFVVSHPFRIFFDCDKPGATIGIVHTERDYGTALTGPEFENKARPPLHDRFVKRDCIGITYARRLGLPHLLQ